MNNYEYTRIEINRLDGEDTGEFFDGIKMWAFVNGIAPQGLLTAVTDRHYICVFYDKEEYKIWCRKHPKKYTDWYVTSIR